MAAKTIWYVAYPASLKQYDLETASISEEPDSPFIKDMTIFASAYQLWKFVLKPVMGFSDPRATTAVADAGSLWPRGGEQMRDKARPARSVMSAKCGCVEMQLKKGSPSLEGFCGCITRPSQQKGPNRADAATGQNTLTICAAE
ncbi:hypothetical protein AYL99_11980 [Fonsecaea erecta]|uniref:Uncharacterized protein n=1 Tax=Fonsecaea erecta TaxID=1367422 RepID=A0A178Z3N0_9EURO|nr:hypothetical protein AYL99_11980 [Fonsecaea erecta]OAP53823.1 hypothetical protein AYL99_11980 [Fonsecaea erecta]